MVDPVVESTIKQVLNADWGAQVMVAMGFRFVRGVEAYKAATAAQQRMINDIGDAAGCYTCELWGRERATEPGTKSGDRIMERGAASSLAAPGTKFIGRPMCNACSRAQGSIVAAARRVGVTFKTAGEFYAWQARQIGRRVNGD